MDEKTKILGGIGSILLVLGIIPYIGLLFSLVGFISLLIAVKQISNQYKDENIFRNFLTGFIINIAGMIIAIVAAVSTFIPFASLSNIDKDTALGLGAIVGISVALLVFYITAVISGLLFKKAFDSISKITNNDLFGWAGNLIFWGSIAMIILLGGILIWIGWILAAIAFFTTETKKDITETAITL
jgi:uncharacterized membrane protein